MSAVFTPSDADQRRDAETADLFRQAAMLKGTERQRHIQAAVELNLPLAGAIASRYARLGCEPADLAQVAALGLVKAATRFDPTLGVPFGAFAAPTIRGEVLRHLRDLSSPIRASRPLEERRLKVVAAGPRLTQELGREPTVGDLAAYLGLSETDVLEARAAGERRWTTSLDAPRRTDGEDSLAELCGAEDADLGRVEWSVALSQVLHELDPASKRLLHLRFVDELTQTQIAGLLGVSQIQVSRLLRRLMGQLRAVIAA